MFGLFKKKKKEPQLTHYVYLNKAGKFRKMMEHLSNITASGGKTMLVYYFEETGNNLQALLQASGLSYDTQNSSNASLHLFKSDQLESLLKEKMIQYSNVVVAEIYPMGGRDQVLYNMLIQHFSTISIVFYTSTDSLLMELFGGSKIHSMMVNMGLDENEKIEHRMISKSILKAQEKIKKKVLFEKPATSKKKWIELNVKANE